MHDDLALVMSSSLETFVASQPWFFLVGAEGKTTAGSMALRASPTRGFDHRIPTLTGDDVPVSGTRPVVTTRFVAALRKRSAGSDQMLSVGRMPGSDILLPHDSVSRIHAWFRVDGGTVHITDNGASNGTRVGGIRIASRTPVVVPVASTVHLGSVELVLLDARGCWQLVRTPSAPPSALSR